MARSKKPVGRASIARSMIRRQAARASQRARTEREQKQIVKRVQGKKLSESERFDLARDAQHFLDRRQRQFAAAARTLRVRKSDPRVVFVLARDQFRRVGRKSVKVASAGDRVNRGDRRKVFIFKHTRPSEKHPRGRLVPYQDAEEKERLRELRISRRAVAPKPIAIQDFDPNEFKSKQLVKWFYAGRKRAHETVTIQKFKRAPVKKLVRKKKAVRRAKPVKKVRKIAQPIDFMQNVVPKVAAALQAAADRHLDRREFELECAAVVRLPSGKTIAPRFEVNFKQADVQQFMELGFYEPFVERKLYAEMAEQLKGLGLVTTGSAQFVENLPINRGRERKDWRDSKGFAWKHGQGWKLKECELVRFDAVPQYIVVRSSLKENPPEDDDDQRS